MLALLLEEKPVFLQDVTDTEAFFYRRLFFVYLTTAKFIVKKKIDKKKKGDYLMSTITKHDNEMAKIIVDPVLWAEHHLGQKPRWYQEQILRHPHNRIVLRCGRRLGKCIAGDQRILDATT